MASSPWFSLANSSAVDPNLPKTAVVVGGGLAGAAAAYRLAEMGWQVTLLEAESELSQQASGNLAGAIHPLVTADWNLRSQFYLAGLEATLRWLTPWFEQGKIKGAQNGVMQLAMSPVMVERLQASLKTMPADFAFWQTPQQASARIGTETEYGGLFFPQGGWVQPRSVVEHCLNHVNIDTKCNEVVNDIIDIQSDLGSKNDQAWQVNTSQNRYCASVVVVATGALDGVLNTKFKLPIRPVKGQVSHFVKDEVTVPLKTTVTHEGYSVAGDFDSDIGIVAISGATFEAPDMSARLSVQAQQHNVDLALKALPNWLKPNEPDRLLAKVGFRPTTPDHLPIIGQVPDWSWMEAAYLQKKPSHASRFYPDQRYQSGLFVSNGHGARGLMSVFLAADCIAKSVSGVSPCLPEKLGHAVHPARFLIRQWRKGQGSVDPKNG